MASTDKPITYYIMGYIEGDEVCLAHATTYHAAIQRAASEKIQAPHIDISVWESTGRIIHFNVR